MLSSEASYMLPLPSSKCRSVSCCEMNDVWRCLCCDMQCVVTTRGLPRTMSPDDGLSLVRCQWCGPLIGQHSVVITGGLPRSGGHIAESGANCSIAPRAVKTVNIDLQMSIQTKYNLQYHIPIPNIFNCTEVLFLLLYEPTTQTHSFNGNHFISPFLGLALAYPESYFVL